MEIVGYIGAALLVIIGLAGTLLPALPGLPLVFGGMLLAAWLDGFAHVGLVSLIVLGALTALGMAVDFLAGVLGAKATGASKEALWGALIGSIAGLALGLVGVIIGPLLGAAVGEFLAQRDLYQAGKVGIGTFIGFIVGTVAKIGCAFAMLATFGLAFLF